MNMSSHGVTCKCCQCIPSSSEESSIDLRCVCPRDELGIVLHTDACVFYKNEEIMYPHEPETCECERPPFESGVCECCACLPDDCHCKKAGRDAFDAWRSERQLMGAFPPVMESTNPLMQKFQQTLRKFLEAENAKAFDEILNLREDLREAKEKYNADLEVVYKTDLDTNMQREAIEEYENTVAKYTREREDAEQKAKHANEELKKAKDKLEKGIIAEREAVEELEALSMLCQQLEKWREETESELTVSKTMTDKMKKERKLVAEDKRKLDTLLLWLSRENWKLESKIEMFKKQMEIKAAELAKVNDKVTAYAVELDDLDLDKRRLFALWNSVLVNIKHRDKVYDSVRDDYKNLQENYRTLAHNLEVTKKTVEEEMTRGKILTMNKEKIQSDYNQINKFYEEEEVLKMELETDISEIKEEIDMCDREESMIKMENQAMQNILDSTSKESLKLTEKKQKIENEILNNLNESVINDKAVEAMANGLFKIRDMNRKLEITLQELEYQHARTLLDIELCKAKRKRQQKFIDRNAAKVRAKEKLIEEVEEEQRRKAHMVSAKQREWYLISRRHATLKEFFDGKSPQEIRIIDLEGQIRHLRGKTEEMQNEWLILQGHVVKLTSQYQKVIGDINLNSKQIQICEQKTIRIAAECDKILQDRRQVEQTLRDLRGRLEVLERTKNDANHRNKNAEEVSLAITHEYIAGLKEAESQLVQIEEDIEALEKQKINFCQVLDRVQKEALIWQRKGILAVELKRNIKNAQSAAGDIGRMKTEIHRMTVRRDQLMKVCERLSNDLVKFVHQRELVLERARTDAALEAKNRAPPGRTAQAQYHHRLRLAKADLSRVSKDVNETTLRIEALDSENDRLETEIADLKKENLQLEEQLADILNRCREAERNKLWLLERVVRDQRLGSELGRAVKRQSMRVKKPKIDVLEDYQQKKDLNDRIKYIVDTLLKEYPHLQHRLLIISNSLNIDSPRSSPRLLEATCDCRRRQREEACDCPSVCPGPLEVPQREICVCEECPVVFPPPQHPGCVCDDSHCPPEPEQAEKPFSP